MNWIIKLRGWMMGFTPVRCRVCNKWTEPSVIEGNICSFDCVAKEKGLIQLTEMR